MYKIKRDFGPPPKIDIEKVFTRRLEACGIGEKIKPGSKVGITVGSRGISGLAGIVRIIVEAVSRLKARPVIIAAMGSHGGGTGSGQRRVLSDLGISDRSVNCPIVTSGECTLLGVTKDNRYPVYVLKPGLEVDHLLVMNRIKPHTSFSGKIESGLTKMLVVGLGGPEGARTAHAHGEAHIENVITEVGEYLLERLPIALGIGVVEDENHRVCRIEVCHKDAFIRTDQQLLVEAKKLLPRLPFRDIDVLVINEMGKCFSGTGMDTNVIGRYGIRGVKDTPVSKYIVVLDLAEASGGNANGVGLADITTRGLINKMDYGATVKNVLTTTFIDRIKIPLIADSDKEALSAALRLHGGEEQSVRLVNIKNTLELEEFHVSDSLCAEAAGNKRLAVLEGPLAMQFDADGRFSGYLELEA